MKQPFIQLFPADLRSDPCLSRCSISARGVWFEFLMVMHINDQCGVISGTREELARDARCSLVEVSHAIEQFDHTKTADVTERNGVVTVVNRRMKRAFDARKQASERVRKHRVTQSVTPPKQESNHIVSGYSSDSGPPSLERGAGENPSLEEVLTWCNMSAGIPKECGTAFWNAMEACGWLDRAQRTVKQWRPLLNNFFTSWKANQQKDRGFKGVDKNEMAAPKVKPKIV